MSREAEAMEESVIWQIREKARGSTDAPFWRYVADRMARLLQMEQAALSADDGPADERQGLVAQLDKAAKDYFDAHDNHGFPDESAMRDVGYSHGHLFAEAAATLRPAPTSATVQEAWQAIIDNHAPSQGESWDMFAMFRAVAALQSQEPKP